MKLISLFFLMSRQKKEYTYENEKKFFDNNKGVATNEWFYLKDVDSVKDIDIELSNTLNSKEYIECLNMVLANSLYSNENDEQFCYIMDKWIEHHNTNNIKLPRDCSNRHPFLHELSHQLPRTINKFKYVWTHPFYKNLHETLLYCDTYGMNAKQRLSISLDSSNITDDIKEWIKDNIGVRACKWKHNNYTGNIIHPSKEEYSC